MKVIYIKTICFFSIALLYSSSIKAQIIPVNEPIELDTNIACTMKVTDDVNRMYIPPRDEVKEVLAGRVDGCATINVNYNNFPVNVINPSQDGPEKAAFQFAIDIWESLLDSPITININANWTSLGASTLGSAGAAFQAEAATGPSAYPNTLYPAALAEKITGSHINGVNSVDVNCNFNSQFPNWYFGTDGNTPATDYDFVTIVLHEIGHGLGLAGFGRQTNIENTDVGVIRRTINNQFPSSLNDPNAIYPNIWDTFMQNEDIFTNNVSILDSGNYPDPSSTLLGGMTNNKLTCKSPIAIVQNGGTPPLMYSISPFNNGSSYSHFDESTFNNTPTALMTPQAARGEAIHDPGDVAMGFMEDMGWSLCGRSLSVEDNSVLENIRVSPNPFAESITLNLPSALANQAFNLSVIDMNGRVVLNQTSDANNSEIRISNLNNLDKSIYFLKIESTTSDISITKKIIKK